MRIDASLVVIFTLLPFSVTSECYFPDKTIADGLAPCDPAAEFTHCCRVGDVCITNGMCFSAGLGSLVQRGCTDSTWNSSACPKTCEYTGRQESPLTYCGNYNKFCCGDDKAARECCDSNSTLSVNVTSGEAMYPAQSAGENKSLKASQKALIALTTVFGVGFLVAGWFAYQGRDGLKQQDQTREEVNKEQRRAIQATQDLQDLENALRQVMIPEGVRTQIENARIRTVPLEALQVEENGRV